MNLKDIVIIGAGGHSKACTNIIELTKKYNIIGYLCNKPENNDNNFKILGTDNDIDKISKKCKHFFIGIGQIKDWKKRFRFFKILKEKKLLIPKILSPNAIISKDVKIGEGTIIMNGVIVNSGAVIGNNCIINTGVIIEHDTIISDHCHIAPGVTICGNVFIDSKTFIGSGSIVNNNINIKKNKIIRSGSTVSKDS